MERRLLTLIALFTAASLATILIEQGGEQNSAPRVLSSLPDRAGDWRGREVQPSPDEIELLGAAHIEHVLYTSDSGRQVGLSIVRERRKRASFHPPEYCYLARSNVSITEKAVKQIALDGGGIEASTMLLKRGEGETLVVYWYRIGDRRTPSYYRHQLSFIRRMFGQVGSDSVMVRVSTQVGDDGVEGALRRVEDLIASLAPLCSAL